MKRNNSQFSILNSQFATIKAVAPGSPASKRIIKAGDVLCRINGQVVCDVLDYLFLSYDESLMLDFNGANGKKKLVRLRKPAGADIGIEFESFLMDKQRSCANKCIFCFIDQLPKGMRKTLYYKDDDVRLSFLQGNYVTLTNLSQNDIQRIIRLRISPINVSVHTMDPELRSYMLGAGNGADGVSAIKALAGAGIRLNCQIVVCPGINDGAELARTMKGLAELGECVNSVSVVPVGLTKHRQGLEPLRLFDRDLALATVRLVERFSERCLRRRGSRVFFCADELYIKAGLRFPRHEFYEDYPQLENGVGMMRLFITEFMDALWNSEFGIRNSELRGTKAKLQITNYKVQMGTGERGQCTNDVGQGMGDVYSEKVSFSIVTGVAACKYLTNLLKTFTNRYDKMCGKVYAVRNEFFGDSVTVSGLVTGGDLIAQLRGCDLGLTLLIPQNMLRSGEDVFLDDVTVEEVSAALGVSLRVIKPNGAELFYAMREIIED